MFSFALGAWGEFLALGAFLAGLAVLLLVDRWSSRVLAHAGVSLPARSTESRPELVFWLVAIPVSIGTVFFALLSIFPVMLAALAGGGWWFD
jgi:hypothetical protein